VISLKEVEKRLNEKLRIEHETAKNLRPLRKVKEILKIEVVDGELHVTFVDNLGNCWIQKFKGEGWKRFFQTTNKLNTPLTKLPEGVEKC